MAPGAVAVSPWVDGASAVVAMFLAGQETGNAWADILTGRVNPSGKLPVTFPLHDEDMKAPCEDPSRPCVYDEQLRVGWRGLAEHPVGFPFGWGRSYTTFEITWIDKPYQTSDGGAGLRVLLTNTGTVPGAEVAQCYLQLPPSTGEPPLVLRAFEKTELLAPGQGQALTLTLTPRHLSVWSVAAEAGAGGWQLVQGRVGIVVGSSSRAEDALKESLCVRCS
mmetsp:Transcript_37384/g.74713  ORF Transcript_37384/g.74713 Transcript_37384/m.74713 type:complete len:221 (-) Transcript_37384:216-878(-)